MIAKHPIQLHSALCRAMKMISIGLRTQIVRDETGLTDAVIRNIHTQIHGTPPTPGGRPTSAKVIRTVTRHIQAVIFLLEYRRIHPGAVQSIDVDAVIEAHESAACIARSHALLRNAEPLTGMDAWTIARDFRSGILTLRTCACGSRYLAYEHYAQRCPACQMEQTLNARRSRNKRKHTAEHRCCA
jgi:hypothetical protein